MGKLDKKITKVVEVNLEEIAEFIAGNYSDVQAEFFNLLGKELKSHCRDESGLNFQIDSLIEDLNWSGISLIDRLYYRLHDGVDHG